MSTPSIAPETTNTAPAPEPTIGQRFHEDLGKLITSYFDKGAGIADIGPSLVGEAANQAVNIGMSRDAFLRNVDKAYAIVKDPSLIPLFEAQQQLERALGVELAMMLLGRPRRQSEVVDVEPEDSGESKGEQPAGGLGSAEDR